MQKASFKYSFCLLTYNQENTVIEAVNGALSQDFSPLEIVISDDCSSDSTYRLIREVVQDYSGPHQIVLNRNEENLGLAGNIHKIHELSKGDVIIGAAGDDISLPHRTRRLAELFERENALLACSYADLMGPNGEELEPGGRTATFYHTKDLGKVARSKSLYLGATGAWQRELYTKYGPLAPEAYEDLVFGFRAALEGRVGVIKEELVKYRLGGGLTSEHLYFAELTKYDAFRARNLEAAVAILRQRKQDAQTFGLDETSPIWGILSAAQTRAGLGLAYFRAGKPELIKHVLRHPLLMLHTAYSERRRRKKIARRIKKSFQP